MRLGATYVPFLNRHSAALELLQPERAAAAGLDNETIAAWGKREIDESFVDALVYPQLGAYYGALPEETSAGFYHVLARYAMDVKLYAVAGGFGTVAERLKKVILDGGGGVLCDARVERVEVGAAGQGASVERASGTEAFDGVVAALPAPELHRVLSGLPGLSEWLAPLRYRPLLSVALLLDRPAPVRYFGLSFPRGESRYLAALCVQENKHTSLVPAGRGLLVLLASAESTGALVQLDSRAVVDRMLPEVARVFPGIERSVTRARVYRWPVGAPIFFPGYLGHLGAFRSQIPEDGSALAVAGDFLFTPSVEGSTFSGRRAAERLHQRLLRA